MAAALAQCDIVSSLANLRVGAFIDFISSAVSCLEVTGTQIGILTMHPEPTARYTLYGILLLFELLLVFVIAGISHRILVGKDQS